MKINYFLLGALLLLSEGFLTAGEIHNAAKNGDIDKVKMLLKENPSLINTTDKWGYTPLHRAVREDDIAIAKLLITSGADLNIQDKNGDSPLYLAIGKDNRDMVELLIRKGADLNLQNNFGWSPLYRAVSNGNRVFVELLINKGADLNYVDKNGRGLIHQAVLYGKLDLVELLIKNGAHFNAKDNKDATPLDLAKQKKHATIAGYLQAFEQGLDQFLDGQSVSITVGNKTIDDKLLREHIRKYQKLGLY